MENKILESWKSETDLLHRYVYKPQYDRAFLPPLPSPCIQIYKYMCIYMENVRGRPAVSTYSCVDSRKLWPIKKQISNSTKRGVTALFRLYLDFKTEGVGKMDKTNYHSLVFTTTRCPANSPCFNYHSI